MENENRARGRRNVWVIFGYLGTSNRSAKFASILSFIAKNFAIFEINFSLLSSGMINEI